MFSGSITDALKKSRALIFDVDGTLAETEETHRRAFNETFRHFKLRWNWNQSLYGELLKITGGKERMLHYARYYPQAGRVPTLDEIAEMHRFKTARYAELIAELNCPLRPGIRGLIEGARARGQQLAIATTTSRSNVEALLTPEFGKKALVMFDVVVAGDEVANKKPAPDVYLRVLEILARTGPECLAIEDSRNGLLSAMGAGIPVIVTPSLYSAYDDFSGAIAIRKTIEI